MLYIWYVPKVCVLFASTVHTVLKVRTCVLMDVPLCVHLRMYVCTCVSNAAYMYVDFGHSCFFSQTRKTKLGNTVGKGSPFQKPSVSQSCVCVVC